MDEFVGTQVSSVCPVILSIQWPRGSLYVTRHRVEIDTAIDACTAGPVLVLAILVHDDVARFGKQRMLTVSQDLPCRQVDAAAAAVDTETIPNRIVVALESLKIRDGNHDAAAPGMMVEDDIIEQAIPGTLAVGQVDGPPAVCRYKDRIVQDLIVAGRGGGITPVKGNTAVVVGAVQHVVAHDAVLHAVHVYPCPSRAVIVNAVAFHHAVRKHSVPRPRRSLRRFHRQVTVHVNPGKSIVTQGVPANSEAVTAVVEIDAVLAVLFAGVAFDPDIITEGREDSGLAAVVGGIVTQNEVLS